MSDLFASPLYASRFLTALTLLVYAMGIFSLVILGKSFPYGIVLLPYLGWCCYQELRKVCLRLSPDAIIYCHQISKQYWRLTNRAGKTYLGQMAKNPYRSSLLIIMTFKIQAARQSIKLVLAYDALPEQNYTMLLARLWD